MKVISNDSKGSWIWRKLLKLRDIAYPFMKAAVMNGEDIFFWFDNWLDQGRLIDFTGDAGTIHFGVPCNARVSDVVSEGSWNIRVRRSRLFPELHRQITEASIPSPASGSDIRLWRHSNNQFKNCFSAAETLQQLRDRQAKVPWGKIVWFSQGIP